MTTIIDTESIIDMNSRIDSLLKLRKIPKSKFYTDIGITAGAMSQWKTGKTSPTYNSIAKIADYLGVSVAYLLGQNAEKTATPKNDGFQNNDGFDTETLELARRFQNADATGRRIIWAVVREVASEHEDK